MTLSIRRTLAVAALCAVGAACREDKRSLTSTDTIASETPAVISLALDRARVAANGTVVARGAFTGDMQGAGVGAFTARLAYDTTRLTFVESESAAAGMGAMHAKDGVVTIAAASLQGFPANDLFTATFRLTGQGANAPVGAMRLSIDELSGVDFANRLPAESKRRMVTVR